MGAAVRTLTRNPDSAGLPDDIDVVRGDLSVPATLDTCLDGGEAALAFLDVVAKHTCRIVYLSSEGVGDDLEQQTDTITARFAAELVN